MYVCSHICYSFIYVKLSNLLLRFHAEIWVVLTSRVVPPVEMTFLSSVLAFFIYKEERFSSLWRFGSSHLPRWDQNLIPWLYLAFLQINTYMYTSGKAVRVGKNPFTEKFFVEKEMAMNLIILSANQLKSMCNWKAKN